MPAMVVVQNGSRSTRRVAVDQVDEPLIYFQRVKRC